MPTRIVITIGGFFLQFNTLAVGRQLLDVVLELEGVTAGQGPTGCQKRDRCAGSGILGAFAQVMDGKAFVHIGGNPAVQCLIGASNQVDEPRFFGYQRSTLSFNSLPALKNGSLLDEILTFSPVLGLRPT